LAASAAPDCPIRNVDGGLSLVVDRARILAICARDRLEPFSSLRPDIVLADLPIDALDTSARLTPRPAPTSSIPSCAPVRDRATTVDAEWPGKLLCERSGTTVGFGDTCRL
jgi:hypothetical protein